MESQERSLTKSLALSVKQQTLVNALRAKEIDDLKIADWYLGALHALANRSNPDRIAQAAHSLRELLEKIPLIFNTEQISVKGGDLKGLRAAIEKKIQRCKDGVYKDGWIGKTINKKLNNALESIECYINRNNQPSRLDKIKSGLSGIDPMSQHYPEDLLLMKKKSEQYKKIWAETEGITHHNTTCTVERFENILSKVEDMLFDLLAPITAEDQKELSVIIDKGDDVNEDDIQNALRLIQRRGANFTYFFNNIDCTAWLSPLNSERYFRKPVNVVSTEEDHVSFPIWWPIIFLCKVADKAPDEVIEIVSNVGETDNPRVLENIVEITLKVPPTDQSTKLLNKAIALAETPFKLSRTNLGKLVAHWAAGTDLTLKYAMKLAKHLVYFEQDPNHEEKLARRKKDPKDIYTILDPVPKFDKWDYIEILNQGIRPLAEAIPFETAELLIDAVNRMIRLKKHDSDMENEDDKGQDFSEIWCKRINEQSGDYLDPDEVLVHILTYSCEQIFKKYPENNDQHKKLDEMLRRPCWHVFSRIRLYLYMKNLEKCKEKVREEILRYENYSEVEYGVEFAEMVRKATELYGKDFLSNEEMKVVFDKILNGPNKQIYKQHYADKFTEALYLKRQQQFHRNQFWPFELILYDKYKKTFTNLTTDEETIPTLENYVPYKSEGTRTGANKSPISIRELANKTDLEIINFLNNWDGSHTDSKKWWIDINRTGLGFIFSEVIRDDIERFSKWKDEWKQIKRPIFYRYALNAATELVKTGNLKLLDGWFALCNWIVQNENPDAVETKDLSEESDENPDWEHARHAVVNFVEICVNKKVDISLEWRDYIHPLLGNLCIGYDSRLDENGYVDENDYVTTAFNTTRARALSVMIDYAFWVKRQDIKVKDILNDLPEIQRILKLRVVKEEPQLTLPERSLLSSNFTQLYNLDFNWILKNIRHLFPHEKDNYIKWQVGFSEYLDSNDPNIELYEILKEDFIYALKNIQKLREDGNSRHDVVENLGIHLFSYYVIGKFELTGEDSLIEINYNKTEPEQWAALINHVGRLLEKGMVTKDSYLKRCIDFFEYRLSVVSKLITKNPQQKNTYSKELQEFQWWMRAEGLDADWRLEKLSQVLDITSGAENTFIMIESLNKLLHVNTSKVVKCFKKVTDQFSNMKYVNVKKDDAIPILVAGFKHSDESVRKLAKQARENLLNAGLTDFINLDDDNEVT